MALLQPKEIAQPQNQLTLQGVASLARHAELAIHSAEVGVSDCMVGPQPGGAAVALGGARGVALREKRGAEVVVRFSEIGLEPDSAAIGGDRLGQNRSEEHTSELQSQSNLVCRLLLEKKKKKKERETHTYDVAKSE